MITNRETPPPLLKQALLDFNLPKDLVDVCATKKNRKFTRYISKKQNALNQQWNFDFFCNPRFDQLDIWVPYASRQARAYDVNGLMLLPCYTDSRWWQINIGDKMQYVDDFKFLNKRLGFYQNGKEIKKNKYWMPCVWIVWRASK